MKKFLTSTVVLALVAALLGVFVACGNKTDDTNKGPTDAEIAGQAISTIRTLYAGKAEETPADYKVNGTQKVGTNVYAIKWTVSSDFAGYENYITVGEPDVNNNNLVTIGIKKATEVIEYTLTATVTVGKASESCSFKHKVPAGMAQTDEQVTKTIDFSTIDNRTSYSDDQQIWEQNGIKVTNDKGASTTNVSNAWASSADNKQIRFYKSSTVTIEYPGMVSLRFYSTAAYNTSDYPTYLKTSLEAANLGTVTADTENNTVTLTLASPMDSITFTASGGQIRLTTLDIVANSAGTSDADKVAGAKATLSLDQTIYTATGTYDLPNTKNGASITWAVDPASDNASIVDGKLNISSMPAADATVTLVATISSNSVSDTKNITITLKPIAGVTHKGTAEDPYTPSEAKKVAVATLAVGETAGVDVYVKGYVIAPGTYSGSTFNNFDNMYIADVYAADKATTAEDSLYVFRPAPDGTYLTTEGFYKGDLVTFKGRLQNYKADTQELVGGVCVAREIVVRDDTQIVEDAKATLTLSRTSFSEVNEELTLPNEKNGATLSNWTVTTETTLVEIANGKLIVKALPETATEITLTVTVSSGSVSQTKNLVITVAKPFTLEAGIYYLALDLTSVSGIAKTYYYNGAMTSNGYWADTTDNIDDAVTVVVAESDTGYTLKVGDKYIVLVQSGSNYNFSLSDTAGVWTLDATLEVLTFDVSGTKCYLGTYTNNGTTRTTISASKLTYLTAANKGETQFPISFVKYVEKTPAQKVEAAKGSVDLTVKKYAEVDETGTGLPASTNSGVTLTWSLKGESTLVAVENNTLKILAIPEEDTDVVLVVTLTCGEGDDAAEDTKEITITVIAPEPFEDGVYKLVVNQANLNKTLYFMGTIGSDGYGETSEHLALAADVTVAAVAGEVNKYTIMVGDKYLELDDAHKPVLVASTTKWWKYDYNLEVFTWTHIEGKIYYIGARDSYTTISASETQYLGGTNKNYPAKFVKPDTSSVTDADKIAAALSVIADNLDNITAIGNTPLATSAIDGVTLTWTLPEGTTAATISNSDSAYTLVVSKLPTDDNVELTLTVSASCGEAAAQTKEVTVLIVVPGRIVLTSKELNLPSSYANEGTSIEGYNFSWIGMADFGSGIQMRTNATTGTSSFWNTIAFETKIKTLTLVWSDSQNLNTKSNVLKIEFANDVAFTNAQSVMVTFSGSKTLGIDIPQGSFTFVRITHNNQGAVYLKSVTIVCAPNAATLDDAGKIEYALDEVPDSLDKITEVSNITLPASSLSDVTFAWSLPAGTTAATIDGNTLKVATLPSVDTPLTLTLTATCGAATNTKTVTVTIKAAETNYGTLEAPISVAAALTIAEDECKAENSFTAKVVYMTGKVTNVPTDKSGYYQDIYLADLTDSTKSILVYTINLRDGGVAPAQNDVLVICGYIKNNVYNNQSTIEFATNGSTRVYIESNTRGTSAITVETQEGATVNGLNATATNGTEVTFTVTLADTKDIVAVKVNNIALTADTDGNYKFTVAGDTKVTVDTKNKGETGPSVGSIDFSQENYSDAQAISSATVKDVTIAFAKGTNTSNAPKYYDSGTAIRCYTGNTVTISVPEGYVITKIVFTFQSNSYSNFEELDGYTNGTWTGSQQSVVFNAGSGSQTRIKTIEITYQAAAATQSEPTETLTTVEALAVDNKKTVA